MEPKISGPGRPNSMGDVPDQHSLTPAFYLWTFTLRSFVETTGPVRIDDTIEFFFTNILLAAWSFIFAIQTNIWAFLENRAAPYFWACRRPTAAVFCTSISLARYQGLGSLPPLSSSNQHPQFLLQVPILHCSSFHSRLLLSTYFPHLQLDPRKLSRLKHKRTSSVSREKASQTA